MRVALALLAMMLLGAGPAIAQPGLPDPSNSFIPSVVHLVGHDGGGVPDPAARFVVVVRDLASNPIPGARVTLDLANCVDMRLCAAQLAGTLVDCPLPAVSAFTDLQGVASFDLMGRALASGPATTVPCGRFSAEPPTGSSFSLGTVPVSCYDLDGNGVGVTDLSRWLLDLGSGEYRSRGDYDGDGAFAVVDLSHWLQRYATGRQVASCGTLSPSSTCP